MLLHTTQFANNRRKEMIADHLFGEIITSIEADRCGQVDGGGDPLCFLYEATPDANAATYLRQDL
jgi:hypothetical protein